MHFFKFTDNNEKKLKILFIIYLIPVKTLQNNVDFVLDKFKSYNSIIQLV